MNNLKSKKIILFGANGYIGRHIEKNLRFANANVKSYGLSELSRYESPRYSCVDICNREKLNDIDWNVDAVLLFSGKTGAYNSFQNASEFICMNEIGLVNILDAIRSSPFRPRLIFPSTRLIYRGSNYPLDENSALDPKTVYAVNKLSCENYLRIYSNVFNIDYVIYRIGVPYGNSVGSEYSYGTIGSFVNQAISTGIINIYGDGSLRRTFTHVEDISNQILSSCIDVKSKNQTYNTTGEEFSLLTAAEMIGLKYNAKVKLIDFPDNEKSIESGDTVFNSEKIKSAFQIPLLNDFHTWLSN